MVPIVSRAWQLSLQLKLLIFGGHEIFHLPVHSDEVAAQRLEHICTNTRAFLNQSKEYVFGVDDWVCDVVREILDLRLRFKLKSSPSFLEPHRIRGSGWGWRGGRSRNASRDVSQCGLLAVAA
jgi:hypothetical protein